MLCNGYQLWQWSYNYLKNEEKGENIYKKLFLKVFSYHIGSNICTFIMRLMFVWYEIKIDVSLWEFRVLGWYGGVESEFGKLQAVEVQYNSEDGHWYIKQGQPPPEQRQVREREVKLTSYILALLCYWRALQLFVLRKFLTESFANFLFSVLSMNNWIYSSFFCQSLPCSLLYSFSSVLCVIV